jgi:hypothetical protein
LLDLDQRSNDLIDTELTFCAGRAQGRPMKDYQKHLEKLRADAAECVLIKHCLAMTRAKAGERLIGVTGTHFARKRCIMLAS